MVLKKRQNYGFNGFQVPNIPRGPRSARRGHSKKAAEDDKLCAIEILASLAGKLLQESESSASSNASEGNHGAIVQDRQDEEAKPLISECNHQGSCAESIFMNEVASQNCTQKKPFLLNAITDPCVQQQISVNNNSDRSEEKVEADVKSEVFELDNKYAHYSNRLVEATKHFRESCDGNKKKGFRREQLYVSSSPIDSDSNAKSPLCMKSFPSAPFSKHGNGIKLGFRDDDENFLRRSKVCATSEALRSPQCNLHRRIKKHQSSKHWMVGPKLKDCELSRSDLGIKPLYRKRKTCYNFVRSQHNTLVKRRKFCDRVSGVTSDGGFSSESVSNSPEKEMNGDNPNSSAKLHIPKDAHVKFSIKSLRIPELDIEVPETATVGLLKNTIMEAVMSILGGDVHVGVLLQDEKVRDDNRTLVQTGISCKENLDAVSFMLESSSLVSSSAVCIGDPSSQCETSQPIGSPETPVLDSGISNTLRDTSLLTSPGNQVESNHESTSSPLDTTFDDITPDSRALVAVSASTEALAVVPVSQKAKRSEFVQRRTRRPFSVSEVEALVHAVEELGTGRWRDVKLRAFENVDHRTYVDLKDKWKTLVHTARISPQQRRGEPVPQELLDRVLAAHAFWTHQNQAKQLHGKNQAGLDEPLKITEASAERPSVQSLVMV